MTDSPTLRSPAEAIKENSRGLRGTLAEGLTDTLTGAIAADDQLVIKFHGSYQQVDRDRREERELKKLERAYSYMIRLRLPGGDISAAQWLALATLCDTNASGTIKITTRQTIQLHGVLKAKLKPTMQTFASLGLDSIAACGDINRNVVAGASPATTPFQAEAFAFAEKISTHLLPKTRAWYEIWLDGEKLEGNEPEPDPLYGKTYLPRKFKIAIAIPPENDTDVFTNDIGLIAVGDNGTFTGFNVAVGGGMGTTHGNAATYPRLGTILGYVSKDQVLDTVWHIVASQRDNGNRVERPLARLKYTLDRMGVEAFRQDVERRQGFAFAPEKPFTFTSRVDQYGWHKAHDGTWFCSLFVENGRVVDDARYALKTALREVAALNCCRFRFTANQNVMLVGIAEPDRAALEEILTRHHVTTEGLDVVRQDALACVALNTCSLALAEGQRYLPTLLGKLHTVLAKHGLGNEPLSIRMTGCPNGCARPHAAEIGFVGKGPGRYNMHIGGDSLGFRLNKLWKENVNEAEILAEADTLFATFAKERTAGQRFGDFAWEKWLKTNIATTTIRA